MDAGIGGLVGATGDHRPLAHQRVGAVLLVGVRAPLWGGDLEVSAGAGVRAWTLVDRLSAGEAGWSPRFALAERLGWWRPIGGPWGFGIGLRVDVDDPGNASDNLEMRTPDGSAGHVPTAYVAIEAGLRHRWTP